MIQFLILLVLMFLGGVLYRLGGAAKSGRWYDFLCNTKTRDLGIPLVSILAFCMLCSPAFNKTYFSLILTFGAIFAVQTTYWKKKGTEATWSSWLFTGLGYSLCWLPTVVAQRLWHVPGIQTHILGFCFRTIVCTGLTVLVADFVGKDVVSENLRGEVEIITLPLLLIG